MNLLDIVSERLSEFMEINNLNCRQLGELTDINAENLRRCKAGKTLISYDHVLKLADFIPCSLNYLVGKSDILLDFTLKERTPFFDNLRYFMYENKISTYQFCIKDKKASFSTYHGWRDGKSPQLETLAKLAEYFNCTLDMLAGREQIPRK